MLIKTSDLKTIKTFVKQLNLPKAHSHKGQNGKLLIIGGSSLFHAASLWSAAIASRIVDIIHYCSTEENKRIFVNLKSKFVDGIVVKQKDLEQYVKEDNCILAGPGMVRGEVSSRFNPSTRLGIDSERSRTIKVRGSRLLETLKINQESTYTYYLIKYLIENFPEKKFVFDAGALQMMEKSWLLKLKEKPILTPHQVEFQTLFNIDIKNLSMLNKKKIVKQIAKKYHAIILVKAINDIISDGQEIFEVMGGNAGLTKGGTGDVLAGLISALNAKNSQLISAIVASLVLKKSAEELFIQSNFCYNATDLVYQIPKTMGKIILSSSEN